MSTNYQLETFGISTKRRNYKKTENDFDLPDLLEIQKRAFKNFVEKKIESVFKDVFPVKSNNGKLQVNYLDHKFEFPKNLPQAEKLAKRNDANFYGTLYSTFELVNLKTGEVKKGNKVFVANIPLLTTGGSFIINGSERIIISQIVRSPGAYFENMKASRTQSVADASVMKVATIIPSRGTWIEWDYKDYELLGLKPQEIKVKIDKNKKIKSMLFFYALGLKNEDIENIFGKHDLISTSIESASRTKDLDVDDSSKVRGYIFRAISTGERPTEKSINDLIPNLLFNNNRYNLTETGRYKLNNKLNVVKRITNRILAEPILDSKGNEILPANKKVTKEQAKMLEEYVVKNDLQYTNSPLDSTFYEYLESNEIITNKKQLENFGKIHIVKIYESTKLKDIQGKDGNKNVFHIIGNYYQEDFDFLTPSDIFASFSYFINLEQGLLGYDDIDSLANRKIQSIDELLENKFRIGLTKIAKNIKDRISMKDTSQITIKNVVNYKLMETTLKEFFNSSQLSQFMDQINPLSEISNKRRITSLGPGGLSRDTASLLVRGIHDTHYGRICPIETPEGPNIGLILNLSTYASINKYGLLITPYYKVVNSVIDTSKVIYLTVDEEFDSYIASGSTKVIDGKIKPKKVISRFNQQFTVVDKNLIDYIDVSPKQIVSIATGHIPFLENDDANRALMGANMQRQAVPLIKPEAPIVATGLEQYSAKYSPTTLKSEVDGEVVEVDSTKVSIMSEGKKHRFNLKKFQSSNQSTLINQRPVVKLGQKIKKGNIIADGPSVDNGELAIGKNVLVGFSAWRGYNYDDAIILSERLSQEDVYTSIHIQEYAIEQRNSKTADETITKDIMSASKHSLRNLGDDGIVIVGSKVVLGDVLVGKTTPKTTEDSSPEEMLLNSILGSGRVKNVKDSSLRVPHGGDGTVIDVQILSKDSGHKLNDNVEKIIKVYVAQKRKIKPGDKMSGRHGNKGVVSIVLPIEDMPHLEDGTPLDVMLNPLGVPSRMNIGQLFELHLGMSAKLLDVKVATPIFNGVNVDDLHNIAKEAKFSEDGKLPVVDGITGEKFDKNISVGIMYMLKLNHMIDDKLHTRSVGAYSLITQQPLRGKTNNGGQRFGEMEAWSIEAYGASNLLQEMITLKSDDIRGRNRLYNAIVKNREMPEPSVPEGFWVLYYELRGLGLNLEFLNENDEVVEVDNSI